MAVEGVLGAGDQELHVLDLRRQPRRHLHENVEAAHRLQAARHEGHHLCVRADGDAVEGRRSHHSAALEQVRLDALVQHRDLVAQLRRGGVLLELRRRVGRINRQQVQGSQGMVRGVEQTHALRRWILRPQHHLVGPERRRIQLEEADERALVQVAQIQHGAIRHVADHEFRRRQLCGAAHAAVDGQQVVRQALQAVGVGEGGGLRAVGQPVIDVVERQLHLGGVHRGQEGAGPTAIRRQVRGQLAELGREIRMDEQHVHERRRLPR